VEKNVLDASKRERARVVRENNAKIKKEQIKKFGQNLRAHNKIVLADLMGDTAISREFAEKFFGITKATENTANERENKKKSFETKKVIENTAVKKESKKKPLKTEKF